MICINFAGDILEQEGSNHAIADTLKAAAAESGKRISIHSSSGELALYVKTFDDCTWAAVTACEQTS